MLLNLSSLTGKGIKYSRHFLVRIQATNDITELDRKLYNVFQSKVVMNPGDPTGSPVYFLVNMEETVVLIEAHYLDIISKDMGLGGNKKIDINKLAIELAKTNDLWCKNASFYTCPPFQSSHPTKDESERKAKYDKFKSALEKLGVNVREGRLQKLKIDTNGQSVVKFTEKGVDTLFTMDLLILPEKLGVKTVIILTCDTDFVPVIKEVKKRGIKVILYYYTNPSNVKQFAMSYYLTNVCDTKILLTKDILEKALFTRI
jgi:uncharacterized LabA/DUF88 family protein